MSFEVENQRVKLTNFNPRPELNGDDPVSAADLKFSAVMAGDVLAFFAPDLRAFLFCKGSADLVSDGGDELRFPDISYPLAVKHDVVGASIEIEHGIGGRSNIKIADCKVGKFTVEPQKGGSVLVEFRVQCHPDERTAGKLYGLVGRELDITLTPPETQDLLDRQGETSNADAEESHA